jgi:serine/threonine protein kinase
MELIVWYRGPMGTIESVCEYIEGVPLSIFVKENLKDDKKLEISKVYKILGQIIGPLKALFDNFKVSHRDIKPDNILIDEKLNVKIVDFGLAKK